MDLSNKNLSLKKGGILDIIYSNGKFYLDLGNTQLDITSELTDKEKINITHLTRAIAYVKSEAEVIPTLYVKTHVHSEYSLLDGMSTIQELEECTPVITALTDHGNMYGFFKFAKAMKSAGKKALLGCEVYTTKDNAHLILIASNEVGKVNLFKLVSEAYEDFYFKPRVSFEKLKKYSEGLICTSACLGGEIPRLLEKGDYEGAKSLTKEYVEIFKDNFYLEIQRHNIERETIVNKGLISLSKELGIQLVATSDSHYTKKSDEKYHEMLLCMQTKKSLSEPHFKFDGTDYYCCSEEEMINKFWDIPEAILGTLDIAKKCTLEIKTGEYYVPSYEVPEGFSNDAEYLSYLIDEGFKERYEGTENFANQEYIDRLESEKKVILNMGYASYFLIVWDYVKFARDNGIMVGPGRGSAAGCLVSYCLKITDLDPIKFGLLFERFLNPERVSMPDIDLDFEYDRRGEVIEYVRKKYGSDRVCNIGTFGTLAAKSVIRDLGKVFEEPELASRLAKLIPSDVGMTISKALKSNPELEALYTNDNNAKELLNASMKMEGKARHTSVHACGIIIAPSSLNNYVPTSLVKDEVVINGEKTSVKKLTTQITECESIGLLKMDFLGLRTMGVIGSGLSLINDKRKREGFSEIKDYRNIPLNDPYIYNDISKGKTFAVFQLESVGMRKFMKDLYSDVSLKIKGIEQKYGFSGFGERIVGDGTDRDSYEREMTEFGDALFERMIAGISLYRPGPMDFIPDYIKNMLNPDEITYDTPLLEPILAPTYGTIVYQEQAMAIVRSLAGFSKGQADTVRKAMGKKITELLDEMKPYFIYGSGETIDSHTGKPYGIKGCVNNGVSEQVAISIWDKMKDFGKYAFNKSHAAVYAVLAVVCGWMKYYYPTQLITSTINTYVENNEKLKLYISVAKDMGISILPPDINYSAKLFTIVFEGEKESIRFGFKGIKNLGATINDMVKEREENGLYVSVQDFAERMAIHSSITKDVLSALIYSGALDCFDYSRASKLDAISKLLQSSADKRADYLSGQMNLFQLNEFKGLDKIEFSNIPELPKLSKLFKEKEFAGFFVTEHPLDEYSERLAEIDSQELGFLIDSETEQPTVGEFEDVVIAGIITSIKTFYTKKDNSPMATLTIEDRTSSIKVVVFPKVYASCVSLLEENASIVIKGRISNDEDWGVQFNASSISSLSDFNKPSISKVYIKLSSESEIEEIKEIVSSHEGTTPLIAQCNKTLIPIKNVNASSSLFMLLQQKLGDRSVIFK